MSTSTAPHEDGEARRRVATDLDTNLFVEAGAGTGKTTALVARVTNLVACGRVRLGEVAAITFTEAAAAELRERIRLSLERAVADPGRSEEERARCAAGLDEVDEAALQTLHGFAHRILASHPVEAGLPPGFSVRDPTEVEVAFEARWGRFLADLQRDPVLGGPLRAAVSLGLTVDNLREVARALHEAWDLAEGVEPAPPGGVTGVTEPVARAVAAVAALRPSCAVSLDALAVAIDGRLLPWWSAVAAGLAAAGDDAGALALVLEHPVPKLGNLGKASSWNVPVAQVKAACKAVVEAAEESRRVMRQHLLERLLPALLAFTVAGAEGRRRDGELEYHDLLVRARRLLRADPIVRRDVWRRHWVVLVDEFQDTDPLQVDLAVLVCTTETGVIGSDRPWNDLTVGAGRLFFVGDPKQSIYRFRRADIDLYARVRDGLGAELAPLVSSFRSTPAVVEAVNAAFRPWFEEQGEGQAPWRDLVAARQVADVRGTVAVVGGEQRAATAQMAREAGAADVVRCARMALDGRWPVLDARSQGWRPARPDDITVLIPTRTALPALERAFEDDGLAYRVEARSLVWATQEVRDLLAVLRAVADPGDEVAAAAALLSGVLACSHQDLSTWRSAGGRWDHSRPHPAGLDPEHPVAEAMACLADWADRAPWATPAALLEGIVRERAVLEAAFVLPRQREAWNRMRFVVEQARSFAASGTSSLRAFVDWAERQADEQAQALESVVPEPDDQAVRVLTIHSAKGLEFPITILAGLNVPRGGSVVPTSRVLWGAGGRLELSCGAQQRGFRTAGFAALAETERVRGEQEQARLLYVACTRARDHLVVCTHRTGSTRDEWSAAADLSTWLGPVPGVVHGVEALAAVPGLTPAAAPAPPAPPPAAQVPTMEDLARWADERRAVLVRAGEPAALAATAVADLGPPGAPPTLPIVLPAGAEDEAPDDPPERPGTRGTAFGRAVHAVLEAVPLGPGPLGSAAVAACEEAAAAEGVDAAAVVASVTAALAAPAARAAAAARRSWREAFVAAEVAGVVVEGFIDLLWEDEAGLHIADWKTDRVPSPADRRAKAERYALQLATYAVALEQVTPLPVVELVLIFCGQEEATQEVLTGPALDAAKQTVHRILAASQTTDS
ncbi:MAG: UvrD-helicase domain-containing protein [Acidimicrobiales bacterium]